MFSLLRNRLGVPGVIAIIALVFAMFGGAYAASNDGGSATVSAKGKKGPRGKPGKPGPTGPAGPAGPAGPKGDTGAAGANGAAGADGAKGATGPTGAAGTKGATGPTGPTGAPWPAGGTLPPGATMTGAWSMGGHLPLEAEQEFEPGKKFTVQTPPAAVVPVPISFAIPLAADLDETKTTYLEVGATSTDCPGSATEPKAEPGHLCVYTGKAGGFTAFDIYKLNSPRPFLDPGTPIPGASVSGAVLMLGATETGAHGFGSWAVTGAP